MTVVNVTRPSTHITWTTWFKLLMVLLFSGGQSCPYCVDDAGRHHQNCPMNELPAMCTAFSLVTFCNHFFFLNQPQRCQSNLWLTRDAEKVHEVNSSTNQKPQSKTDLKTKPFFLPPIFIIQTAEKTSQMSRGNFQDSRFLFPLHLTCRVGPPLVAGIYMHPVTPILWRSRKRYQPDQSAPSAATWPQTPEFVCLFVFSL